MLSKQDRAMRAAYQHWAAYYRELGPWDWARAALKNARKYHTEG